VRATLDIAPFRAAVVRTVAQAARGHLSTDGLLTFPATGGAAPPLRAFLLQAFEGEYLAAARAGAPTLPYCAETICEAGVALSLTDDHLAPCWSTGVRGRLRRVAERTTTPFVQTLGARRAIALSDTTLAMFESQGNALAMLRSLRVPSFRRPGYVIISCWLVRDLQRFGRLRKLAYRFAYRSVDRVVYFSANQTDVIARELRVPCNRLRNVHFGVDDEFFHEPNQPDEGFVLAVGRDAGRDWRTFLDAVRGLNARVKLACREGALDGLAVPSNVEVLGYVDRATYRDLLQCARVVVVASEPRDYPTGQSVTLEAMACGRCCVVTETVAMSEYVLDGETALLVPPRDAAALRATIERALDDEALRSGIGARARQDVEERFTARAMWARIAEIAREAAETKGR
jgi:glycosyltransferase involved in cell wall biosynthesis